MANNLYDHITANIWPPNSSGPNQLDYYVWSIIEKNDNEQPHSTKHTLTAAIVQIRSNMNKDHLIIGGI